MGASTTWQVPKSRAFLFFELPTGSRSSGDSSSSASRSSCAGGNKTACQGDDNDLVSFKLVERHHVEPITIPSGLHDQANGGQADQQPREENQQGKSEEDVSGWIEWGRWCACAGCHCCRRGQRGCAQGSALHIRWVKDDQTTNMISIPSW